MNVVVGCRSYLIIFKSMIEHETISKFTKMNSKFVYKQQKNNSILNASYDFICI